MVDFQQFIKGRLAEAGFKNLEMESKQPYLATEKEYWNGDETLQ